jgi:hypothetical protein
MEEGCRLRQHADVRHAKVRAFEAQVYGGKWHIYEGKWTGWHRGGAVSVKIVHSYPINLQGPDEVVFLDV